MEKEVDPRLFVNDGSFMERFKQLQQEKGAAVEMSKSGEPASQASTPKPVVNKTSFQPKVNVSQKSTPVASSGKLAFTLKQKLRRVEPAVKLSEDEDEEEKDAPNASGNGLMKRQKTGQTQIDASEESLKQIVVVLKVPAAAPPPPSDLTVKKVADKLASFVAKNGRQFEHITQQKNPGDTPFKFLFDTSCADYKYYEYRLREEEKVLSQTKELQTLQSGCFVFVGGNCNAVHTPTGGFQSFLKRTDYQTPASALYESGEEKKTHITSVQTASLGRSEYHTIMVSICESTISAGADPIAVMEFYMKKAAQEERNRPPRQSNNEMPAPASLQGPVKKGHHMGDFIPPEELQKFLASCNDVTAQRAAREAAERAKIQADNVGHKLLSKMGWKEGEGLGSSGKGIANPITAGNVKLNNLGVGAHHPGEVTPDDDIYEQYKKQMMLGYRYRPNPLNNPRKAYY
ncbi:hypothetical protein NMG60_11023354 [Bertholletia excelsa]